MKLSTNESKALMYLVYSLTLVANIHILPGVIGQVDNQNILIFYRFIVEDCDARNITTAGDELQMEKHRDDNTAILASPQAFDKLCASKELCFERLMYL